MPRTKFLPPGRSNVLHFWSHFSSVLVVLHLPSVLVGLRWGFFFVWDRWLIGLRFVFGAWGRGLGGIVRANVRVHLAQLAGNGRCC